MATKKVKTAIKSAPAKVGPTKHTCFICNKQLMSNGIYTYLDIQFNGASKSSNMRYTCKQDARRTADAKK